MATKVLAAAFIVIFLIRIFKASSDVERRKHIFSLFGFSFMMSALFKLDLKIKIAFFVLGIFILLLGKFLERKTTKKQMVEIGMLITSFCGLVVCILFQASLLWQVIAASLGFIVLIAIVGIVGLYEETIEEYAVNSTFDSIDDFLENLFQ